MKTTKAVWIIFIVFAALTTFFNTGFTEELVVTEDGKVGIGTSNPQAALDVQGKIHAGNSDIYFTKTNHNHTGFGNTAGYAAIENAADLGALSIIGRAGTSKGRYVRLWDYLQVNGGLDITGNVGIGTSNPQAALDVQGKIHAGNSDIYFTNASHNYTAFGNTAGYAAIENAANYGALMILGRAGTSKGRYVRLWDYLQVNGGMDITGNVGIGTATPQSKLHVVGTVKADTVSATTLNATTVKTNDLILPNGIWKSDGRVGIGTTNPVATADFSNGFGMVSPVKVHIVGNVFIDGSLETTGKLSYVVPVNSDARLKEDIQTISGPLDKVGKIRGVSYNWIDKSRGEGRQLGVIAQEVEQVFPEVVHTDGKGYKSVEYSKLVAPLIEAVKALKREVELLQSENDQLDAENQTLMETNQRFEERLSRLEQMVSGN